jgi:ubiquinone/menaquinone biosynthesis C-methylase UbiE
MKDVWATVADLDTASQQRLADVLEQRGRDAQQRKMRETFLDDVPFGTNAKVLELGCGTGVFTRLVAQRPAVDSVVGVDPAPSLLDRAVELASGAAIQFKQADARSLPFGDATFDVVIADSVLVHIPSAESAVREAFRVLSSQGVLAAFEGDYATTTVALGDNDPLQVCADFMMANSVNDRWLVRRLPAMLDDQGFAVESFRSHGFTDTTADGYMVTVIDRGADLLLAAGIIGQGLSQALKDEARRRADMHTFFGHIAYASIVARKP